MITAMTRVVYETADYRHADECLRAIRQRVDLGWILIDVRGPDHGPFSVVFRKDVEP